MTNQAAAQFISEFAFWAVTSLLAISYAWVLRLELRSQNLQGQIAQLRLHVSENYATNTSVEKLTEKLDKALAILYRLEGRKEATED